MNETFVGLVRKAADQTDSREAHEALATLADVLEDALKADDRRRGIKS